MSSSFISPEIESSKWDSNGLQFRGTGGDVVLGRTISDSLSTALEDDVIGSFRSGSLESRLSMFSWRVVILW